MSKMSDAKARKMVNSCETLKRKQRSGWQIINWHVLSKMVSVSIAKGDSVRVLFVKRCPVCKKCILDGVRCKGWDHDNECCFECSNGPVIETVLVEVPARPAKSHPDCLYCGCGGPCTHVCGQCKEAGIDGPVIRGTEYRKAYTRKVKLI